jgi:hypothetical protein
MNAPKTVAKRSLLRYEVMAEKVYYVSWILEAKLGFFGRNFTKLGNGILKAAPIERGLQHRRNFGLLKGFLRLIGVTTALHVGVWLRAISEIAKDIRSLGQPTSRKLPKFRDKEDELDWANKRGRWKE